MRTSARMTLAALCLSAVTTIVGGCNDPEATDFDSITDNPTPELMTLNERKVDVQRNLAVVYNNDFRMMWMDLGRAWYVDRPSFLSPYYIVPTSGQPR